MEPWPGEFKREHQFKADEVAKIAEIKLMFFIEKLKKLRQDNPNDADFGAVVAKKIQKL